MNRLIRCGQKTLPVIALLLLTVIFALAAVLPQPAAAATTTLTVKKLASDGKTVLAEKTITYQELRDGKLSDGTSIPVLGDGTTRYYHQGPVFIDDPDQEIEQELRWNEAEDQNWDTKDMGALKGTNLKDLCNLVGGMAEGDTLEMKASDGFKKTFAYKNIYQYTNREGPMVICWQKDGQYPDSGYTDGMRLVWFAEATYKEGMKDLPAGNYHVFGNWDWRLAAESQYWYFWYNGLEKYPTTTGLSVQNISELIIYSTEQTAAVDVLYEGAVTLATDKTFSVTAYNSGTKYTVDENTPLGALQAAATAKGFTYDVGDKNYAASGALLLDNVGDYKYVKGGSKWYAYVNGVHKDGFNNPDGALNLIQLADGDKVEFYFAAGISNSDDFNAVKAAATATVKTVASISDAAAVDVLYEGAVTLATDKNFSVTAYNSGTKYTVDENTPLGALQAAATAKGFTYDVGDKNYAASGALLLDNVGDYKYVKGGSKWYAYVNGVHKDGFNNPDGALNLIQLADGDKVEFYFAAGISNSDDFNAVKAAATATVKTVASIVPAGGTTPTDWTLQLTGAKNETITKAYFEQGLACSATHRVTWTDEDGNTWGGVPLWLLVGLVDDDPDIGPNHFNFNDDLAALNYEVNVIAGDGWKATFDSTTIARNNGYIIANTLNGEPLPQKTENGKGCWPLHLKGSAIFGGQQVGNITKIELTSIPEPPTGWTLEMLGKIGDTITQEEFEKGLACIGSGHYKEWTDKEGNVWSGTPLWVLLGAVDDIEKPGHWTFNPALASDYSVKVIARDGFSKTFAGADVAKSADYIVANKCNGVQLTGSLAPLRLVGKGVAKDDGSLGGAAISNIARIELPELRTPPAAEGSWNLTLTGKISAVISQAEFEAALACPNSNHRKEWTDGKGNIWSGMPLWLLAGWVDDRQPHTYDANQANAGYTILVKATDGYTKDFNSKDVTKSNNYIIADKCNGAPLTDSSWPLRLIGAGVAKEDGTLGGTSVGNIGEIELTSFGAIQPAPELHIVKYAQDGVTILKETTVDYLWMEQNLEVIGDGKTVYKYEGITNNPNDIWDAEETYPGGFKIANAVKGTLVKDLCELVGGMGSGTEIVLVAIDGWETRLPYSSIYTDPSVQKRQGDAILAWYSDGEYVPQYKDGMRLFFTPGGDNVYGQWDMHETLPEPYWHYYYGDGVMYPSCAGLSVKWITEIKLYSLPQGDWNLKLDGRNIGGMDYDVSKTYFESALTCQFGANHKAAYTDPQGQVWEGMPLWFLVGFVDDNDQHSSNAFNNDLAQTGYQVVITAVDGHSVKIDSKNIKRGNDYIVANTKNGAPLPESGSDWPLRLVGPAVSEISSISQIAGIDLITSTPSGDSGGGGGGGGGGSATVSTTSGSAKVRPSAGGTIGLGEEAKIKIPAGALNGVSSVEVKVAKVTTLPKISASFRLLGNVYEFSVDNNNSYNFKKDVTVTLSFDSTALLKGETPAIYYYDEAAGQWVKLGGTVSGDTVIVEVDHFTKFAVMAAIETKVAPEPEPDVQEEAPEVTGALTDIAGHWAENNIKKLVATGAVSGYPDATFKPENKITRAEFAAILVKAFGLEDKDGKIFTDTAGHWAQDYIAAAVAGGVASGYDADTFGPDNLITREQMAVLITKAAKLSPVAGEVLYGDSGSISDWAKEAAATATENGIMKGYPDNTFQPQGSATRAEAVTVIVNAIK
ncbi:MAG: S-layer homology domain-containing protein [Desulfotomaculaceae bacterium]|nr:S-layer homology domain-containing protein [Desulfotomaculaceae bacterium]